MINYFPTRRLFFNYVTKTCFFLFAITHITINQTIKFKKNKSSHSVSF
ncbi:hypothetical protein T190607A02C_100012 [Tenacibaculum sp. 190524A02b]